MKPQIATGHIASMTLALAATVMACSSSPQSEDVTPTDATTGAVGDAVDTSTPDGLAFDDVAHAGEDAIAPADMSGDVDGARVDTSDVPRDACAGTVCGSACVDTQTDPHHCGDCTLDCATLPHVTAGIGCESGRCSLSGACAAGFADCDHNSTNGCETDLSMASNCGACGAACSEPKPVCMSGAGGFACASGCSGPTPTRCTMMCVDTTRDPRFCGSCAVTCPTPAHGVATCTGSTCGITCASGYHACGTACADDGSIATCGKACSPCAPPPANAKTTCDGTTCGFACDAGFGRSGTGCEDTAPPVWTGGPTAVAVYADTVASAGQLVVSWSAATDNVTPSSGIIYQLCWSTTPTGCAGASFTAMSTTPAGALTATLSSLQPYTSYIVRVRARDAAGNVDPGDHSTASATAASYSVNVDPQIFNGSIAGGGCGGTSCHSPRWTYSNTVNVDAAFLPVGCVSNRYIVPSDPSHSLMVVTMMGPACGRQQQPHGGPFNPVLIEMMNAWVTQGAHNN